MQKISAGKFHVEPPSRFTSFDHLVGAGEQRERNVDSGCLGRLGVDHKVVLCWRLHRQVARLLAFENAIDVTSRAPVLSDWIRAIGDEAAPGDEGTGSVDRRQMVSGRKPDDQVAIDWRHGRRRANHNQALFDSRTKFVMPRSISSASCTPIGINSTLSDAAAVWIAAKPPDPADTKGSRRTATRVTPGATSLSSSSNFAFRLNSYEVKPVALPPGRARLATKPPPTGSIVVTNTIGTVRLACCKALTIELAVARMTSGANATNSVAYLRYRSVSPAPQRVSTRTLNPTSQPNCCNSCANAALPACPKGSSAVVFISTPMRRMRSPCCARTASGQANAAPPPSSVMNSRRVTRLPRRRVRAGDPAPRDRAPWQS